jgi:TRAP-type mannitol/chloroaromatic compound transport system permease small subunit
MQFSFARFSYLFKLQLAENRKLYLLGMAAIAGIMLCFMFVSVFTNKSGFTYERQIDFITVALLLTGVFFASLIFKQYGDKDKRIQSILLPVSNAERLAVAVLFIFFLFPLVFLLVYFICIAIVNAIDVHVLGNLNDIYMLRGIEGRYLLMTFCLVQSVALLGAVWFRRFTFVKTVVLVCLSAIFISGVNEVINKVVVKDAGPRVAAYNAALNKPPFPVRYEIIGSSPYRSMRFSAKNEYGYFVDGSSYWLSLPDTQMMLFLIFLGLVPLFFSYVTLVKIREQQL